MFYRLGKDSEKPQMEGGNQTPPPPPFCLLCVQGLTWIYTLLTGGCFLRCYYKHFFVHISSHVLYLSLGYFPCVMYQQGINPEMFLWLFGNFLSLFICKRLKSETQSLKSMPTHAYTRTVCLCFLELPSHLENLISRINLWQNNLESFPGSLYSKSRPSSSVSPNSLVTFLAGHFTPLHFKLKGHLTTLLKQQSFGTSVNFVYDNGRFDIAIASFNKPW